jgi:putative ABC transport system permease protein
MLLSYLKLSLRLLARNPFLTAINVAGLSVGFAVFFVLWQYAQSELNSDRQWKDWENIFRLKTYYRTPTDGTEYLYGATWPGFPLNIAESYPGLSDYVRLYHQNDFDRGYLADHDKEIIMSFMDNKNIKHAFREQNMVYADPNLFQFFSIPLIQGNTGNVLEAPNSIALSEATAIKYFGQEDAIGKTLLINDSIAVSVTGVFKNLPSNTHLKFDAVLSINRIARTFNQIIPSNSWAKCYFKVKEGSSIEHLEEQIEAAKNAHLESLYKQISVSGKDVKFSLQPLKDISFSLYILDFFTVKSKFFLQLLQVIAMIILIMAWINYINLTLSSNQKRMKEVVTRKTVGALYVDLIKQFIVEATLVNVLSIILALTLIQIAKHGIQLFLNFYIPSWSDTSTVTVIIIAITLISGILLTAIYPAMVTLKSAPESLLRSHKLIPDSGWVSKNGLTVLQLTMSSVMVIFVFSLNNQLDYIFSKDLGLKKDNVVIVDLPNNTSGYSQSTLTTFTKSLLSQSGISNVSVSTSVSGDNLSDGIALQKTGASEVVVVDTDGGIDHRFIPLYNIQLVAGRNFSADDPTSQNSIIVSRKALQRMGFEKPEDALNKTILVEAEGWTMDMRPAEVIGIMEDYVRNPLLISNRNDFSNDVGIALTYYSFVKHDNLPRRISIRLETTDIQSTIDKLDELYSQTFPESLFHWYFLDEFVNRHYAGEKIARNQVVFFTIIAIGIACLGLLGMISNKVVEKTKEIGIRKVLGAQLHQIAQILLSTTFRQIIIATIIGIPVAYYLTQQYLQKFSERIELQWWHFALPVLILVLIMLGTVAAVVLKAAKSNPVEALKYE